MNMEDQISAICRTTNIQLRKIGKIRRYLNNKSAESIIHALVTSRLDNNNALLVGAPDFQLQRLQKLQNTAARIVSLTKKYDHITPILQQLHWLPIANRIKFKIMLLTYKALNQLAPQYITDLLQPYTPAHGLRSANLNLLAVPKSNLTSYGDRSFAKIAPVYWNSLPDGIRNARTLGEFKSLLKTHLFNDAYL